VEAQDIVDQATSETRAKSLEKLIDIRTGASLRDRTPGQSINPGVLAATAIALAEAAIVRPSAF
jgi:hypothetical protein